ncbi:MAG: galactokinase [Bacteroidota bacterium]|nr:galactokinase [Bacteroidota bacterium]
MIELIKDTIQRYHNLFSTNPEYLVIAPGRVNLIGEHTDYNLGYVLPVAIDRNVIIAAGNRHDDMLNLHTVDLQASISTSLSNLTNDTAALWSNYPMGVAYILRKKGYRLHGANLCIRGNIPIGAGLSSSAALEVGSAIAFNNLNGLNLSLIDLIKISHEAETDFVGVHCGIMDQFIAIMGKHRHALLLDCQSLKYDYILCPTGVKLVVCDTGVRRELARSAYNKRQEECNEAVRQIAKEFRDISSLREVTSEQLETVKKKLSAIQYKRAKHVITENGRVLKGVDALRECNLPVFGSLMLESHLSLRDYYEVSCRELNVFVEVAMKSESVYGARMTGAGFGGSAICLVAEDAVDSLVDLLRSEYPKRAGRSLTMYLASTGDGAAIINPKVSLIPKIIAESS